MQMVKFRSQRNIVLFDGSTWARLSDEGLAQELCDMTASFYTLQSATIFNILLAILHRKLQAKYGDAVTLDDVKRRIQRMKMEFLEFRQFLTIPGVRLDRNTMHVRLNEAYWHHCKENGWVSEPKTICVC